MIEYDYESDLKRLVDQLIRGQMEFHEMEVEAQLRPREIAVLSENGTVFLPRWILNKIWGKWECFDVLVNRCYNHIMQVSRTSVLSNEVSD